MEHRHHSSAADASAVSAAKLASRLLRCPAAAIAVWQDGALRFSSWHGLSQRFVEEFSSDGASGLTGVVFATKRPFRASDIDAMEVAPNPAAVTEGVRSVLAVPLSSAGEMVGCLYVADFEPRDFTDEDQTVLEMIADELMLGLESAWQLSEERRGRVKAEVLLEVASAAASGDTLRRVLVRVAEIAVGFSIAERCSIFLYDTDSATLLPFVSVIEGDARDEALFRRFVDMRLPRLGELRSLKSAIEKLEPIRVPDARNSDLASREWIETFGARSAMIYPLAVKDRVVGIIALDTCTRIVEFPEDEIAVMSAVASDAALVVERMRLQRRLQEQAQTDALTGLMNRHTAQLRLNQLASEAAAQGSPLSILLIDIDNLGVVNDMHGSDAGDLAIARIADVLRLLLPPEAFAARWDGDEFLMVLPGTTAAVARGMGRRVLHEAARRALHLGSKREIVPLYVSIGQADVEGAAGVSDLLSRAQAAQRQAKLAGGHAVFGYRDRPAAGTPAVVGLLEALTAKTPGSADQARQVAHYATLIAEALGVPSDDREQLRLAALLHDVGNLGVPNVILEKAGPLDETERDRVRQHVALTKRILEGNDALASVLDAASSHHEWWDGTGYPNRWKGDDIPIAGRILAVADAYVSMRSERAYRTAKSHSQAIAELRSSVGSQFDPAVVDAFIAVIDTEAGRVA